jgi:glutamyl-tRNA synthetase
VVLHNAVFGAVKTRFPPEPSGYLHIGHAKAAFINFLTARAYGGKMLLRFEDTNPTKEKAEYEDNILADLQRLGVQWDEFSHTSDHFELILECCTRMLKSGKAYVEETPADEVKRMRTAGIASPFRERPLAESLKRWEEMKKGTEEGLRCCVRAKINFESENKVMRDPVIFRCNLTRHHRTGYVVVLSRFFVVLMCFCVFPRVATSTRRTRRTTLRARSRTRWRASRTQCAPTSTTTATRCVSAGAFFLLFRPKR